MRNLPYPLPIPARRFVPFALLLLGLSGCNGGGGADPAPTAVADSYLVNNPGDTLNVSAPGVLQNDSGSGLTAQLISYTGPGSLTLNSNGSFTYTDNTATSFTYRAVNGSGSSAPVTVTIGINQPPIAANACLNNQLVNTPINGTLTATDEPGSQPVTFIRIADPAIGPYKGSVLVNPDGTFTYTPNTTSVRGMDKFRFRATDQLGLTSDAIATVFIDGSVRIMPLGDSITAGLVTDATGNQIAENLWVGYRRKLYNDLTALYQTKFGIDFVGTITNLGEFANPPLADRANEGHDGWRDDEILNGSPSRNPTCPTCNITDWLNSTHPDIVLLHIGTNGVNDFNGDSAADVEAILDKIQTWETVNSSSVTVFLARIIGSPDTWTYDNVTLLNNNVEAMARARIASGDKIVIVDQQDGAGLVYSTDDNSTDVGVGFDDFHPTQTGYDKMADKWKADLISSSVLPSCP